MYFQNLSNEEKFALASAAAVKIEQDRGYPMSKEEYEDFVWNYPTEMNRPKYQ